jgi:hypothetical protein
MILFTACNNTDLTPAYLEITEEQLVDLIDVTHYNQTHEANYDVHELAAIRSSLFRNVWVTVNNDNRGIYKLPCKIPILKEDSCTVSIMPGIWLNGSSSSVPAYPYISSYKKNVFLMKGETTVFDASKISFSYVNNVTFPVLETFEAGTIFGKLESDTGATFQITTVDGDKVGLIALDYENTFFDVVSSGLRLPGYGQYVFLEIDYKCDADFSVGLLLKNANGYQSHDALVNVAATDTWKKIYINLTQSISRNYVGSDGYATDVQIYLSGFTNYDDNGNPAPTNFYMDNIKVLYVE